VSARRNAIVDDEQESRVAQRGGQASRVDRATRSRNEASSECEHAKCPGDNRPTPGSNEGRRAYRGCGASERRGEASVQAGDIRGEGDRDEWHFAASLRSRARMTTIIALRPLSKKGTGDREEFLLDW
jgi:hypothetical protein